MNYNYDDRYLLTASLRSDGSSRYSKGNKWGYFPSAAVAWRLSQESFLRDVDWISDLKLRVSYELDHCLALACAVDTFLCALQRQTAFGAETQRQI